MTSVKEAKKTVEVFPDYCSTGLWLVLADREDGSPYGYHVSITAKELEISDGLAIAIKYWHAYWESYMSEDEQFPFTQPWYVDRWIMDGRKLVELLNAESTKYTFVHKE